MSQVMEYPLINFAYAVRSIARGFDDNDIGDLIRNEGELLRAHYEARFYHDLSHIKDVLQQWGKVAKYMVNPKLVRLALWFHDCEDSEIDSANRMTDFLNRIGVGAMADEARGLVMATSVNTTPATHDERYIADIDLSILGADPEDFLRYEAGVRREYAHVEQSAFCAGRTKILQCITGRKAIYQTAYFHGIYERQARQNLKMSLARLADDVA